MNARPISALSEKGTGLLDVPKVPSTRFLRSPVPFSDGSAASIDYVRHDVAVVRRDPRVRLAVVEIIRAAGRIDHPWAKAALVVHAVVLPDVIAAGSEVHPGRDPVLFDDPLDLRLPGHGQGLRLGLLFALASPNRRGQ